MDFNYKKIIIAVITCLATVVLATPILYAVGYPHSSQNNIECGNCHWLHGGGGGTLFPEWAVPETLDIDDKISNNLCRGCHNDSDAIAVQTHSSRVLSKKYGDWAVECRVCHDPHKNPASNFLVDEERLVEEYECNPGEPDENIRYKIKVACKPAESCEDWDEDALIGLVVYPDKNDTTVSYKIVGNESKALFVAGPLEMCGVPDPKPILGISYGKLVRATINTDQIHADEDFPRSDGIKDVIFTGPETFADGDGSFDGVCEVCHKYTDHFRNDGSGPDQLHENMGYPAGTDCTECHDHRNGFGHGGGKGTSCGYCHGHDLGWYADEPLMGGRGTFKSHSTHTEDDADDVRGPKLDCDYCHDTDNMPYLADGETLETTTVCDECHSDGGTYDGVNDPTLGAKYGNNGELKYNWYNRVYEEDNISLKAGMEKWCATCHDETPSVVNSINAPNVIGDEDGEYTYGTGYGYYKTGHGLVADKTFPSKGGIVTPTDHGRPLQCTKCHDTSAAHVDGEARTFSRADGYDSDEYRKSYRLNLINGFEPMEVPWTGGVSSDTKFRLCTQFGCHDPEPFTTDTTDLTKTNFITRSSASDPFLNRHKTHLSMTTRYPADYDYAAGVDSKITCVVCHNVHGSTRLAMVRDGKLINREPGLEIWYVNDDLVSYISYNQSPPDPENLPLSASTGTIWKGGSSSNICSHCHGNNNTTPEYRCADPASGCPPFQGTDQKIPILYWTGEDGYVSDGVIPDSGTSATRFTFRVMYTDFNYDAPTTIQVWIDRNDDGDYNDPYEKEDLAEANVDNKNYNGGKIYYTTLMLSKAGDNKLNYRFYASDDPDPDPDPATGDPTVDSSVIIFNSIPTLEWTGDPNFVTDGVHYDVGGNGASFEFRVSYTDLDNEAPTSIQVWIDEDDSGTYEETEKYDLAEVNVSDTDFNDGKEYSLTGKNLSYTGDGILNYRFYASDGVAGATGTPTENSMVTVLSSANTPPQVDWHSDTCLTKGVKPALGAAGESFEFAMTYSDPDGCPTTGMFQVWVDLDGGGYSVGEQHDMEEADLADGDCTDGKVYTYTMTIPAEGTYNYRFYANDDSVDAVGEAITESTVEVIDADAVYEGVSTIQSHVSGYGNNNKTVLVYPGTYTENISFTTGNGNNSNITLQSVCGPEVTTIQAADPEGNTVYIQGVVGTVIDGFTITGGVYGIVLNGGATFKNNIIENNTARGIYSITTSSRLTLQDSIIRNNTSTSSGAGIFLNSGGPHSITGSVITNITTTGSGAGIYLQNSSLGLTIEDTIISNNTLPNSGFGAGMGAGIFCTRSNNVNINRVTFSSNTAAGAGGGLYLKDGCAVTMTNSNVVDNTGGSNGGGLFLGNYNNLPINLTMNNCTVSNNKLTNTTSGIGGGLYNRLSDVSIHNSIFWGNEAAGDYSSHDAYASLGTDNTFTFTYSDVLNTEHNFGSQGGDIIFDSTCIAIDPQFVDSDNGDYHLDPYSPVIDQGTPTDAPDDDIDGDCRSDGDCTPGPETTPDIGADEVVITAAPTLSWTGEENYTTDGVDPDSGVSETDFTFRVKYTDENNDAPAIIQVWIDEDESGAYSPDEKFNMTEDGGDNYIDGKLYTFDRSFNIPGGAILNFRFYATDGSAEAIGAPTEQQSLTVLNHVPTLSWTDDAGFTDGVNPKTGGVAGTTLYAFRIDYTDGDDTCPTSIQVWIDEDDNGAYGESEKYDLTEVNGADLDCNDGKRYSLADKTLPYTDGAQNYRFYATDGQDDAIDEAPDNPTSNHEVVVLAPVSNTAPTLSWASVNCLDNSGVRPAVGGYESDFQFIVNYTDADTGQCADTIQVWIDEDDSGTYEETEKYDLGDFDGDTDCTDGKLYSVSRMISLAGDNTLAYRFYATDGVDIASGEPVSSGGTLTVLNAPVVRPAGSSLSYDFTSIDAAVDTLSGTILVYPNDDFSQATYPENVTLVNRDNINIISTCGPDLTVISSASGGTTVSVQDSSNFLMDGFSLTGATNETYHAGFYVLRPDSTTATIRNSRIYGNSTGISINDSDNKPVQVENVEITANNIRGIYLTGSQDYIDIVNCEIHSHNVTTTGSALDINNGGTATITNSIIRDNTTTGSGTLFIQNSSHLTVTNSILVGNTAANGGVFKTNGATTLNVVNSTIADNTATNGGVLHICALGSNTFSNSIFWNNTATNGNIGYKDCGYAVDFMTIELSDVDSNPDDTAVYYNGTPVLSDNIYDDSITPALPAMNPLFVDAPNDDYHIQDTSPCRDAIPVASFSGPGDDFDGQVRPQGNAYDMGADEYFTNDPNPTNATIAGTATATAASESSIDVSMPYSGDDDNDNTYTVEYSDDDGSSWTMLNYGHSVSGSPFTTTIEGLTAGQTYDFRVTYVDSDGVGGDAVQTIEDIELPVYATTPDTATAEAASYTSIDITIPYTDDDNGNNTYHVSYSTISDTGPWIVWDSYILHRKSPYAGTINDLTEKGTYWVRVIYNDIDGVNEPEPKEQVIGPVDLSIFDMTTTGVATAVAVDSSRIAVTMPYTNDLDEDNTYTVEYCVANDCIIDNDTGWTTWVDDNNHSASPYETVIEGLTVGQTYDVRVTYLDDNHPSDGVVGTNPQMIEDISLVPGVSGTVYSDESVTPVADGTLVKLIVNGVEIGTDTTVGGEYFISTSINAGDEFLVYLDGEATDGTTVTVAGGSGVTGIDIYGGHLIVRKDNGGSMTNGLMSTALGAYVDTEILYSVTGSDLTVSSDTELFVPAGHSFTPGGIVNTVDMDIDGTLDAEANGINVSGSWDATGGLFTSTGTVTFNAASGIRTIIPGGNNFQNIVIDDAAGTTTFELGGSLVVDNDLTINDGIFDTTASNYNVTVVNNFTQTGGQVEGNSSTFTVGGNFQTDDTDNGDGFYNASLVLNGTGQSIIGSLLISNLTKTVDVADTLTFEGSETFAINGTVTLNGVAGQLLTLTSSDAGSSPWYLDLYVGATKAMEYVSVSWSDASGSDATQLPIEPTDSEDGGYTIDWFSTPKTFIVNATDDSDDGICNHPYVDAATDCTLREAINAANFDDDHNVIEFDSSIDTQPITIALSGAGEDSNASGDFDIIYPATISGNGPANTIIRGGVDLPSALDRIFHYTTSDAVTIQNVTLQYGEINSTGGCIFAAGNLTVTNSVVDSCQATSNNGGAIYGTGSVTINNSTISNSTAGNNGGGVFTNGGTMTDVTFTGNHTSNTDGGAIYTADALVIDGATFSNNYVPTDEQGGTIYATGTNANVTISNASFTGRPGDAVAASGGGAIFMNTGGTTLDLNSVSFTDLHANNNGGAVFIQGGTMTDVTFTGNHASMVDGGAIYTSGDLVIDGTSNVFSNNYTNTGQQGGTIYATGANVTISNAAFSGNNDGTADAASGGAVYMYTAGTTLDLDTVSFTNFHATNSGGAVVTRGGTMTDVTFDGNHAGFDDGGAIYSSGDLVLNVNNSTSNTFSNNYTGGDYGGAIYSSGGTLTVSNTTFTGDGDATADAQYGGAIFMNTTSVLTVTDCSFTDFYTSTGSGAIYIRAGSITGSTFENNSTDGDGGAVYGLNAGIKYINSTFSANDAGSDGGALYSNAACTIKNSTFYENTATATAEAIRGATCTVANTIVAKSTASASLCTGVTSNDYNLQYNGTCFTAQTNDQSGDPLLGVLTTNGGPTETHALLTGSPAIDNALGTVCTDADVNSVDQRGVTRTTTCDIGAYEYEL